MTQEKLRFIKPISDSKMKSVKSVLVCFIVLSALVSSVTQTSSWSNGGYSEDPSNPDYGTHDWIAEHALDWLPASEKEYIVNNLAAYLYGTELPDNPYPEDGIGDTTKHHIYYDSTLTLIDDSAAVRAQEEYDQALSYLSAGNHAKASKTVGILSHYIVDLAVFGHVMGATTEWGAEEHHGDYESYVNTRTNSYYDDFNIYLSFDGELNNVSAYDAVLFLAYDTTFDLDGDLTSVWMDNNYDWSNPTFKDRCGESLNLAVNYLTEVLHTLYAVSKVTSSITCTISKTTLAPSEILTVSGSISPVVSGKNVTLTYTQPGDTVLNRTVPIGSDGSYNDLYTPGVVGEWRVTASWSGDASLEGAISVTRTFTVIISPTEISCNPFGLEHYENSEVVINGKILPAVAGATVYIIINRTYPHTVEYPKTYTTTTDAEGDYQFTFRIGSEGSWYINARWNGDQTHYGAVSSIAKIRVLELSGCLIATATFGSEMAPEVQFLRSFRTNTVLTTFAGQQFMAVFNGIYYSFSPTVASSIASNEGVRTVTHGVLYPLIRILQLGEWVTQGFTFSTNLGIVAFCLVVSALLSLVYLVPWAVLLSYRQRRVVSTKVIHRGSYLLAGSAVFLLLAIAARVPFLTMSSGAVVVLAMTGLTTVTATRTIMKRLIKTIVAPT